LGGYGNYGYGYRPYGGAGMYGGAYGGNLDSPFIRQAEVRLTKAVVPSILFAVCLF